MFQYVRRKPGERYNEDCILRTVKHPPAVMVWGCISADGPGPLHFVEGTLRQEQYKRILSDVFLPYLNSLPYVRSHYTFMQDGAPCHSSKLITNFLMEENIDVLPWPGNSPDQNPIENCWAYLKSKVYNMPNPTVAILKQNIENIWYNNEDFKNMISSCIKSMPSRIKSLIKEKGGSTRY